MPGLGCDSDRGERVTPSQVWMISPNKKVGRLTMWHSSSDRRANLMEHCRAETPLFHCSAPKSHRSHHCQTTTVAICKRSKRAGWTVCGRTRV